MVLATAAVRIGRGFLGGWGEGMGPWVMYKLGLSLLPQKSGGFHHFCGLAGAGRYHPGYLACGKMSNFSGPCR